MNLIIDGNYILYKNVHSLVREKLLYGCLFDVLEKNINKFKYWYSFENIYLVSDSKTSWRKKLESTYKEKSKKDDNIDWEFVFTTYDEFKESIKNSPKTFVFEEPHIEGDDWVRFLNHENFKKDISTLIISSDKDLTQLLTTSDSFINIMLTDSNRINKIYLPSEYSTWIYNYKKSIEGINHENLLFDDTLSDQQREINFIEKIIGENDPIEINRSEVLFKKIVGGDRGDNIPNIYKGLGEKTTNKVFDLYFEYFGKPDFSKDCFNKICDIIIDLKKLDSEKFDEIKKRIDLNNKLINLYKVPNKINERILNSFNERI